MPKLVDAHNHYRAEHPDFASMLDRHGAKLLNICVALEPDEEWHWQADAFRALAQSDPDHFAWCTTTDLPDGSRDYAEKVVADLERDLAGGAVAVKFWKNIGMEMRSADGSFLMIDDPLFDPIFDFLSHRGVPVCFHMAEPIACWRPLDERSPHYGYYSKNPEWYMYGREGVPSHGEIMDARDHVLAKHPALCVVGAHLGSMEHDLVGLARRLRDHPNFAIDTSARLADLAILPSADVREFLCEFSDRVLFGTDLGLWRSNDELSEEERAHYIGWLDDHLTDDVAYYRDTGPMTVGRFETEGLGLGADVLDRILWRNAEAWYPGL